MQQVVAVDTAVVGPALFEQDLDGEFVEGFFRHNAEALWQNTHGATDAAWWFFKSGQQLIAGFPRLCNAFGVDPDVIRREVMRELHRQHIARIFARDARWQKVADWYSEQDKGAFPFDWLAHYACIPKRRLQQDAIIAIAHPAEYNSAEADICQLHAA